MNKLYSLMFIIIATFALGFITNVNAVHLSNSEGKIPITINIEAHNPVSNTYTISTTAQNGNPATVASIPDVTITFNNVAPTIPSGNWYGTATKTGTLDLTGIDFVKPGLYSFDVFSDPYISQQYIITVAVRNEVDEYDVPTGNQTATIAYIKENGTKVNDIIYSEDAVSRSFSLAKRVEGTAADDSEYFKVLVTMEPCTSGRQYYIYYYDNYITNNARQINYKGTTINRLPYSHPSDIIQAGDYYNIYTCGQQNYVYLKHNETVNIFGEFETTNFKYKYIEQDATNYETYYSTAISSNNKDSGWFDMEADNTYPTPYYNEVTIKNVSNTPVPTGAYIKYLPYAAIFVGAILLGVIIIIINRKKKKKNILEGDDL